MLKKPKYEEPHGLLASFNCHQEGGLGAHAEQLPLAGPVFPPGI